MEMEINPLLDGSEYRHHECAEFVASTGTELHHPSHRECVHQNPGQRLDNVELKLRSGPDVIIHQ